MWIPAQSGRFPGTAYESIKPTNPINQSVFIRRLLRAAPLHTAKARREEAVVGRQARRAGARSGSREFGAYFLLAACSRL